MIAARPSRLVQLRGARRIWAAGSIHGTAQRLLAVHDQISERFQEGDRVVYLGNYFGYGEAVRAAIDELLDFRRRVLARRRGFLCDVTFLRETQEEMLQKLLQLQFAANPGEVLTWMVNAGIEPAVRAYGGDLRHGFAATRDGPRTITRWTSTLRDAINATPGHSALRHAAFTEEGGLLLVHAGVDSARALATKATHSGGADKTSSISRRRLAGSAASSGARTLSGVDLPNAHSPYRSTPARVAAGDSSPPASRRMGVWSTASKPDRANPVLSRPQIAV